jgi:hypothetical protein
VVQIPVGCPDSLVSLFFAASPRECGNKQRPCSESCGFSRPCASGASFLRNVTPRHKDIGSQTFEEI